MSKVEPLRWKYHISSDVEATTERARQEGFSVVVHEGQPKGGRIEPYPLGTITVRDGPFKALNVKVQIGPRRVQVYKYDREVPDFEKIDEYLNMFVVRVEGEQKVFCDKIRVDIQSISMIRFKDELISGILKRQDEQQNEYERERAKVRLNYSGKECEERLEAIWIDFRDRKRLFFQMSIEKGVSGMREMLAEFEEGCAVLDRLKTELEAAKDSSEENEIVTRYHREHLQRVYDDLSCKEKIT
jgi:hypothetical protein